MNIVFLGWLDRLLGAGLGFVKAVLIASVVLVVLTSFLPKNTPLLAESRLSRHVTIIAEHLAWPLKNEMKKEYSSKLEALKKTWEARQ
jgi:membrane protein required for colicin V production